MVEVRASTDLSVRFSARRLMTADRPMPRAVYRVLFAPTVMVRTSLLTMWLAVCLLGHWPRAAALDHPRAVWTPYRTSEGAPSAMALPALAPSIPIAGGAPPQWIAPPLAPATACVDCLPEALVPNVGASGTFAAGGIGVDPASGRLVWQHRMLPEGLVWRSYLAGVHEPRFSGIIFADKDGTPMLDVVLGGRMAVWRYGTNAPGAPEGYELQIEGAALPRLNLDQFWDLEAVDFRFGVPLVWRQDRWQWKAGYYHLSAHMGDELAAREGILAQRINYARDVLIAGVAFFPLPAWRWYAEAGWAFYTDGGAEPWEFQFGVDIATPGPTGPGGVPFAAVNGQLHEEVDFGGSLTTQAGWLWRGNSGRNLRLGVHYYNGKSSQYQFFDFFEEQLGVGLWGEF